jgi:DNA-binding response OmpR family regulator
LQEARRCRPEVVLFAIGLLGTDGFEGARQLRQEEHCRALLIIGVSGYGDIAARKQARGAGFDHHLVKPLDVQLLLSLICKVAERR